MRESSALWFGGVLLGIGVGWYIFGSIDLSQNTMAWLFIILGAGVILSGLMRWVSPGSPFNRLGGSIAGGLVIALFMTQGFSFISSLSGTGGWGPYTAQDTKTFTGASTEPGVYFRVDNINGPVTISTWDRNEYEITAVVKARGFSQNEADQNLARMTITMNKDVVGGRQQLILTYDYPSTLNPPYSVVVTVKLPSSSKIDLNLASSNGYITITDILNGGTISLLSSNGRFTFTNVSADTITGSTSNGGVEGHVDARVMDVSTSNGSISLAITGSVSGSYDLSTSNGAVNISTPSSAGYRITARTSNGVVTFDLPNVSYSRDTNTDKSAQTTGYDSFAVKLVIDVSTSNGNVKIGPAGTTI
jgi:DUF4097 and DUF4098 domain-containing protein YvlB